MTSAESRQRPYKVWSCDRQTRKAVMASNLRELRERGASRLGLPGADVKIVLESDGTEVEDDIYFQTIDKDTIFLILCPGERWLPPGVEALRAAITAIPRIVCEAINSMELIDKQPSWKIMDNKGRVTVVLHWDQRDIRRSADSRDRSGDREAVWRVEVMSQEVQTADTATSTDGTVISIPRTKLTLEGLGPRPSSRMLPQSDGKETSPEHDHSLCDFHCSALHEKGAQIHVNKSVATSPIQEVPEGTAIATATIGGVVKKGTGKGHVRFSDVAEETKIPAQDESESDTENTANEEEQLSERYLLLVDQLSLEQNRHLSVKDLGIILERLSSKIVDVDRLERERESTDVHNWTIKATIRGEVLREIGVIYNGQYYGIMEHPGYF
ncbi:uncharacterized protein TNIN_459231 [Trichonephila inaurata madagascariensis]|uniref:CIDE-N domain-containing protein n=1 Tax=Trichonephila inaurata madagascariensis TaxID=2747483 RepID=A0A8X6YH55_9ARAC|nr:uncharacterized protein TNIN_459231 [Trichonephila inaurata madagascariensis]